MSADGTRLLDEGMTVYTGPVAEGTKIFKKDGYYYLSIPEGGVGTGWQTILRSKNIYGPYEKKVVLEQGSTTINGLIKEPLSILRMVNGLFFISNIIMP